MTDCTACNKHNFCTACGNSKVPMAGSCITCT
jgi:hypothetical protein